MKIYGNVYKNLYHTMKSPKRLTRVFIWGSPKTGWDEQGTKKAAGKHQKQSRVQMRLKTVKRSVYSN